MAPKNPGGRPRKYTPEQLGEAVTGYFRSISRTITVKDDAGEPIRTDDGRVMTRIDYPVPPTVGGLCGALGITTRTWENYCCDPDYQPITAEATRRFREYLEREVLIREGKDVRGPQFILQACHGFSTAERREIDLGPTAAKVATAALSVDDRERLLREIAEEFGGDAD